ncbi:hypothetical protein HDU84_008032 [Entophlyctis sp. JEL0112]|nr:hypothetical protein HDU84_008032 [Entophlyctis sp. JEL0112]
MNGWTFTVGSNWINPNLPTVASLKNAAVSVLSRAVKDTMVDISIQASLSNYGYSMDEQKLMEADLTFPAISLKAGNYKPNYFQVSQNNCARKNGIAFLGSQFSGDNLGGLVIATTDGFNMKWSLRDLSQDPTGGLFPNASICFHISSCGDLQITHVVMFGSVIVYGTNRGLYLSTSFPLDSSIYSTFSKIITGQSVLDGGSSTALSGTLYVTGSTDCLNKNESFAFVSFSSSSTLRNNLIYSNEYNLTLNIWSSTIQIADIPWLTGSYQFVDMKRFSPTKTNIILAGIPSSLCGSTDCAVQAVTFIHDPTSGKFSNAYAFPLGTIVVGIGCHSNGIDCYVYGSELWHSIDGGNNWNFIFSISKTVNSVNEVFKRFDSSRGQGSIALLTNLYNVYYGRAGVRDIVLSKTFKPKSTNLVEFYLGEAGELFTLNLETITGSYSNSESDYPMGFLQTVNGQTRGFGSDRPYLKRIEIPIESIIPATDFSFAASLVPVQIGTYRVQFYALASVTGYVFSQSHVGTMISQISGSGQAIINSVSLKGLVADCTIITNFTADSVTYTTAIDMDLTIPSITVGDITTPLISDSTSPASTTLTLSGSGSGIWKMNDIGKTVVANYGVFLITAITSSTVATVAVYRAPLTVGTVSAGSWNVYDFRSYNETSATFSQTVTIGSASSGIQSVTLSSGVMTFDPTLLGMFLVTSSGWGIILDVTSTTTLYVSAASESKES